MRMLTIDDSAVVRRIISAAVEVLGHECVEAESGQDALNLLAGSDKIELIFLDWNMPGMNGLEFLKTIKKSDQFKHIPVIMVTTENMPESVIEAVKAGVSQYITKPFSIEELMKKIVDSLGGEVN
ncbi:MAG: two-component system, chemotaxis family, chemotaxis protein CheY [Eubacteriaceae bacterium]|nr:two-component system, chemotaxis family, chemotaxis protein CheY [Eubacteriaceae bacterium]